MENGETKEHENNNERIEEFGFLEKLGFGGILGCIGFVATGPIWGGITSAVTGDLKYLFLGWGLPFAVGGAYIFYGAVGGFDDHHEIGYD